MLDDNAQGSVAYDYADPRPNVYSQRTPIRNLMNDGGGKLMIAVGLLLVLYVLQSLISGGHTVGSTQRDIFVWIDVLIAICVAFFLMKAGRRFSGIM